MAPNDPSQAFDKGPWRYHTNRRASSGLRNFVESENSDFDVRLYINGDFSSSQFQQYGDALAEALNAAPGSAASASLYAYDKGTWRYQTAPGLEFASRYFIESSDSTHDVRLYINGNFADDAAREQYGAALADRFNAVVGQAEAQPSDLQMPVQWEERIAQYPDRQAAEYVDAAKDAELAELRAILKRLRSPAPKSEDGNFHTQDNDLDLLLGLTEDFGSGNANGDTAMLWMAALERVKIKMGLPVE